MNNRDNIQEIKILLTTIRYVLFSTLLLILAAHTFIIFSKYHNMTIIGYIFSYPSAVLFYIGIGFFIVKKNLTDFITLAIFAGVFVFAKVIMFVDIINYCKEEHLRSIESCSNAVIPIIFGRDWIEDSLNIFVIITILFLIITLLKRSKIKFK